MTAPSTFSKTEPVCVPSNRPRKKRILFASVHSVLDFSNGASVATLDILQGLTTLGFECQAFCTAKLDLQNEVSFEKMIGDRPGWSPTQAPTDPDVRVKCIRLFIS